MMWLLTILTLLALATAGFALMRANRVDHNARAAIAAIRRHSNLPQPTAAPVGAAASGEAGLRVVPDAVAEVDPAALRHVGLVRYDAFADIGGRLSYSLALLDGDGDGVVLSAIQGRDETRSYAKQIIGGQGESALSPEEEDAVRAAMTDSDGGQS